MSVVPAVGTEDATCRVVWETIDQETVRVTFAEAVGEPSSDGVPALIEPESSRTVAVTLPDLDVAATLIESLARRDGVLLTVFAVDPSASGRIQSIRLCIADWWRFHRWFPRILGEAEDVIYRMQEGRKASALVFRLRLLAKEVERQQPPMNHVVLCLE